MGPKKAEEPERKPLIGRVGTNLKIGIVGVPNVGKVRKCSKSFTFDAHKFHLPVDFLQRHYKVSSTS